MDHHIIVRPQNCSIETKAVAVGIGYSWGEGVLSFQGKEYPFKIKGLSVVDVGISSMSAQVMQNQNGVVMKVTSKKSGIQL